MAQWYDVKAVHKGKSVSYPFDTTKMVSTARVSTPALLPQMKEKYPSGRGGAVKIPIAVRKAAAEEYLRRHFYEGGDPSADNDPIYKRILGLIGKRKAKYFLTQGSDPTGMRRPNTTIGWVEVGSQPPSSDVEVFKQRLEVLRRKKAREEKRKN